MGTTSWAMGLQIDDVDDSFFDLMHNMAVGAGQEAQAPEGEEQKANRIAEQRARLAKMAADQKGSIRRVVNGALKAKKAGKA